MWTWPENIRDLEGGGIKLELLSPAHTSGLVRAAGDASQAEWDMGYVPRPDDIKVYVNRAVTDYRAGRSYPFAVCLETGEPIGTSWFRVFDPWRRKLEIGFTWYARSHRKGTANLQTKLLLMSFAFEELKCCLVEFLVHEDNAASQRAVSGLGAHRDGMLRRVIPMGDGSFGDVVVFSVSDAEWPPVKETLLTRIEQRRRANP
ncbi:MAG: GNAT family N-acetyltransferase [Novosphingobium sp.]